MLAVSHQLVLRQDRLETLLALGERETSQVPAASEHEVEHVIDQPRFVPERVLKQLEPRYAVLVECDEFAIEYGVTLQRSSTRATSL